MSDLTSISSVGLLETGCEDGRASKGHADGRKEESDCPELVLFERVEFDMGMRGARNVSYRRDGCRHEYS